MTEETYANLIKLSDVEVHYVTNSAGKLDKEVMTVKLSVDFDVSVVSLKGDFTYTFTIDV